MKNFLVVFLPLIAVLTPTTGAEEAVYVYAKVGDTVTLTPTMGLKIDARYVYWGHQDIKNGWLAWQNPLSGWSYVTDEQWKTRLSCSGFALTIKNIKKEDLGIFTFSKRDEKTRQTIRVQEFKLVSINVSMNPASLLLPGESLSLTCDVETPQYGTAPKVSWLNPQGKIYYGVSEAGFAKLPLSVTSQDNGQWTCVVVNDGKESKATISVSVFYLFPIPENPQYLPESQPLTIPCSLPRSISWSQIQTRDLLGVHWEFTPKPSSGLTPERPQRLFTLSLDPLTWKVNQSRELSPVSAPSTGNMSLSGKKARERDRGDYVCTFEFKNGWTLNRTVRVEVLRIVSSPGTEVTSGKQIDLSCSLGRELPSDLHLKWIPPEHSSLQSLTFDHHSTLITIPEAGTGDSGMWRCELWQSNTLLTSAVITLKINPKLSVWMLVTIGGGIVIIVLLILLFILRQCRQKMRHPRHRFCQCKNPKPKGFYRT